VDVRSIAFGIFGGVDCSGPVDRLVAFCPETPFAVRAIDDRELLGDFVCHLAAIDLKVNVSPYAFDLTAIFLDRFVLDIVGGGNRTNARQLRPNNQEPDQ